MAYKRLHGGMSPSVREMTDDLDFKSTSNVHYHLRVLEKAGRIRLVIRPGRRGYGAIAIPGERWLAPGEDILIRAPSSFGYAPGTFMRVVASAE